jgi:hypothetical protein
MALIGIEISELQRDAAHFEINERWPEGKRLIGHQHGRQSVQPQAGLATKQLHVRAHGGRVRWAFIGKVAKRHAFEADIVYRPQLAAGIGDGRKGPVSNPEAPTFPAISATWSGDHGRSTPYVAEVIHCGIKTSRACLNDFLTFDKLRRMVPGGGQWCPMPIRP